MNRATTAGRIPPIDGGLAAVTLGAISMGLFALPVLGIPLSVCGLLFALLGLVRVLLFDPHRMQLALAGGVMCLAALGLDGAMWQAPSGWLGVHDASPCTRNVLVQEPRRVVPPARSKLPRLSYREWHEPVSRGQEP